MSMTNASAYKLPARGIRTGHVITIVTDRTRRSLEVEIIHHGTHVGADGSRLPAVWFTGLASDGVRVERGWAQLPNSPVWVVDDVRGCDSYLEVA